ncbi:MAG TPA: FKBP-type peptidyl-prolyl cis-trans isomerase [Puia sp.]|nr:FKBP-type peptidyl-prolyl cis-trans isomerase [Puia sp.]
MKAIFVFLSILVTASVLGQTKKPAGAAHPKAPVLLNANDSLSYALGMSAGSFYKQQGMSGINTSLCSKGINDALKTGATLLNEQQANAVIMAFVQKESAAKAAGNKKAGAEYLAANKNKPGVVTLASGLQYMILKEGIGPKPTATDKVRCHYEGSLIDGSVFESSIKNGKPIDFAVNGVIPGWTEALQLMPVGSKWRLFIPSNLGYGDQGNGLIKPGSTLIFDVELLEILK